MAVTDDKIETMKESLECFDPMAILDVVDKDRKGAKRIVDPSEYYSDGYLETHYVESFEPASYNFKDRRYHIKVYTRKIKR